MTFPRTPHHVTALTSHVRRWYSGEALSLTSCIMRASLKGGIYTPPVLPAERVAGKKQVHTSMPFASMVCIAAATLQLHLQIRKLPALFQTTLLTQVCGLSVNNGCRRLSCSSGCPVGISSDLLGSEGHICMCVYAQAQMHGAQATHASPVLNLQPVLACAHASVCAQTSCTGFKCPLLQPLAPLTSACIIFPPLTAVQPCTGFSFRSTSSRLQASIRAVAAGLAHRLLGSFCGSPSASCLGRFSAAGCGSSSCSDLQTGVRQSCLTSMLQTRAVMPCHAPEALHPFHLSTWLVPPDLSLQRRGHRCSSGRQQTLLGLCGPPGSRSI